MGKLQGHRHLDRTRIRKVEPRFLRQRIARHRNTSEAGRIVQLGGRLPAL